MDTREALIRVPIRRSLTRHMTFLGGERTPVMGLVLFCVYLAFMLCMRYSLLWGLALPGLLWLIGIYILRKLGEHDPQSFAVFWRARRYKDFYPARGRFNANTPDMS